MRNPKVWLSHTGIETMGRCPRCFWLQYVKGIYQPEGIVSRLANRFDKVLKNYFEIYRDSQELPPMVNGKIKGRLQKPFREIYFATIDEKYGFKGKLDECIINEKEEHIPLDFKTSSSDPRLKEILAAYQSQIDAYIFLLIKNSLKTADFGYLMYVYPDQGKDLHNGFPMVIHIEKVKGDPNRTTHKISKAIDVLEGKMPTASPNCPFCNYRARLDALLKN